MQRSVLLILLAGLAVTCGLVYLVDKVAHLAAKRQMAIFDEMTSLRGLIAEGNVLKARKAERERTYSQAHDALRRQVMEVAPSGQGLSWIKSRVDVNTQASGVTMEAVTEGRGAYAWPDTYYPWGRQFEPLSIRMQGSGRSEQITKLIGLLGDDNPFATAHSILILTDPKEPDLLRFDIVFNWPRWINPDAQQWFADVLARD